MKAAVDATATTVATVRMPIWPWIRWFSIALRDDADVDAATEGSETGMAELLCLVVVASADDAGGICSAFAKHPSKRHHFLEDIVRCVQQRS